MPGGGEHGHLQPLSHPLTDWLYIPQTPNCDAQATLDADLRTEDAAFRVFYALFTAAMVALALWLHFEWYAKIAPAAEAVVEADAAVRSAFFPPAAAQRWS
jgi:hypothetical protein